MVADFEIGVALGAGSARGWAHIGAVRAPVEAGIRPDIVCGTSIGALVAAAYADNALAGEPADAFIMPRVRQVGLLEYHRAGEAIVEGRAAVELVIAQLVQLLKP